MTTTSLNVILAPHVDDELIGCWSLLKAFEVSDVHYFYELDNERRTEAVYASHRFKFEPHFHPDGKLPVVSPAHTVWIPAITDNHPHHKELNRLARSAYQNVRFYSVDLEHNPRKVKVLDFEKKRKSLDELYPSQAPLWLSNASYYLFECLQTRDFHRQQAFSFCVGLSALMVMTDANAHGLPYDYATPECLVDALIKAGATKFRFIYGDEEYSL